MSKSLILSHPRCLEHDPGYGHPESPARLQGILAIIGDYEEAPPATEEQILLAHDPALLRLIKHATPAKGVAQLDADTFLSAASYEAALHGSGATCLGVDRLMQGEVRHVFCASRPPGHHATHDQAMGFCLFNHIAIAACHARKEYGLTRIAIVDFDVHHGNGTQNIVKGKPGLFYVSTHQSPFYPGTGYASENIAGNILNVPLPAGTTHAEYLQVFSEEILPALHEFKPELLLVSAGFDAHHADPLAALQLTEATYQWLGAELAGIARQHAQSRMLSTLEGGYHIHALQQSVAAYLAGIEATL